MKLLKILSLGILASIHNVAASTLDCDHVDISMNLGIVSMRNWIPAGICLSERGIDNDTGLVTTEHMKYECIDDTMFISQYSTSNCDGSPIQSGNFEQMMALLQAFSVNMTDMFNQDTICNTGKTCPYVKLREWDTSGTNSLDCSASGTNVAAGDLYEDEAFVLDHCIPASAMGMNISMKYECNSGVVTKSMWMGTQKCDGAALESKTGSVNGYLECDGDDKVVIIECSNIATRLGMNSLVLVTLLSVMVYI